MLRFAARYGPVSRFSNPAKVSVGGRAGADTAAATPAPVPEQTLRSLQPNWPPLPPLSRTCLPQLNGAAGWLFLNHPDDIAHVCAANTRNYSERCEWLNKTVCKSRAARSACKRAADACKGQLCDAERSGRKCGKLQQQLLLSRRQPS